MDLKKLRTEKGYTQQQLADKACMPKRTVEDIQLRGDCMVSNAAKLAEALDITIDELWNS